MMYPFDFIALLSFLGLLAWAAVSDGARFLIPNRVCGAIVLLYPVHVLASPEQVAWLPALGIAAAVMAVGTFIFSQGWAGGGDVKLFAAVSLWAGPHHFASLIFVTAMAGGVLAAGAVLLWLFEKGRLRARVSSGGAVDAPVAKPVLPYGIAIATGGAFVAVQLLRG